MRTRSVSPTRHLWNLHPEIDFLNHGSFGACPTEVLHSQRAIQDSLERDPIRFLAPERDFEPRLDSVRKEIAQLVHADPDDLAWVRNATEGVNAVVRSLRFSDPTDSTHSLARKRNGEPWEVIVTNHGYNACNNAVHYAAACGGGIVKIAEVPFPIREPEQVVDAIVRNVSSRTKLIVVDHVTSPTGLIFPVAEIVAFAHQQGIRVMIDGAHAPGMVDVDLRSIDADYYTANHHKWLCGPKASGFLYVRKSLQPEVRPVVISHAANRERPGRSKFMAEFDWQGTFDPSPLLAMPTALAFLGRLHPAGLPGLMQQNHRLVIEARNLIAAAIHADLPAPDHFLGSMATIPLPLGPAAPPGRIDPLQQTLFEQYGVEVPVFCWPDRRSRWLRISSQSYNHLSQYQRLADALVRTLPVS